MGCVFKMHFLALHFDRQNLINLQCYSGCFTGISVFPTKNPKIQHDDGITAFLSFTISSAKTLSN